MSPARGTEARLEIVLLLPDLQKFPAQSAEILVLARLLAETNFDRAKRLDQAEIATPLRFVGTQKQDYCLLQGLR